MELNKSEKLHDKLKDPSNDPREHNSCSPSSSVQGSATQSDHLEDEGDNDNQEEHHKVLLQIDAVVKGYHECPFVVYVLIKINKCE